MPCCNKQKSNAADGFNFARAVYALRTGKGLTSNEDAQQRWSECLECDQFDKGMCNQCGCHMSMKVRVAWAKCPVGKWRPVSEKPTR